MGLSAFLEFAVFAASLASALPSALVAEPVLAPRASTSCDNTATSRGCWGNYNINTSWYDVVPETGVTREVRQGGRTEAGNNDTKLI
jgi:hypothetical protein